MLFAIGYRWTAFTGGESGLGGVVRPSVLGLDLGRDWTYYWVAARRLRCLLPALALSTARPVGSVLVAIRENEQRARFVGYATNRYKLLGFVISATVVGHRRRALGLQPPLRLRRAARRRLLGRAHRHGGDRRHAQLSGAGARGLFFILFREFLSIWTPHWLFWFGLLFVGFIMFSPTGLVGVAQRLCAPFRRKVVEDAAMAGAPSRPSPLPDFLKPADHVDGAILQAQDIAKSFGGTKAVQGVDLAVRDRSLHALIGPNGAGKTTAFNLISGLFPPTRARSTAAGKSIAGLAPEAITQAGIGRSFQITNLFPGLSVEENIRLAVQARHPQRFNPWTAARSIETIEAETSAVIRYLGVAGMEKAEAGALSYGGQRLLDMGLALATKPRVLLLDEPLAGLAAAERQRIGDIIKRISLDMPMLLVEHDIDRVFQIADAVTVMNAGQVLVDGTVEDARSSPRVQEIYIGSGAAAVAAKPRESAAEAATVLTLDGRQHVLRQEPHSHRRLLRGARHEIVALLGRNGAGKSTLLKT
jgi:ABC-type branched-subunit amino acid transport system ATPase component